MINEGQVPPALFLGKPGLKSRFDSGSLTGADIDYLTKVMRFRELQDASNADYGSLKLELPLPSEVHPASSHAAIEERMYDYFLENVVSRITSMLSSGMVSVSDNFLACKAFLGVPERIMGSFGFDTHDFSGARGKKFLVLGSGSRNSPYNRFGTEEPWLCR